MWTVEAQRTKSTRQGSEVEGADTLEKREESQLVNLDKSEYRGQEQSRSELEPAREEEWERLIDC